MAGMRGEMSQMVAECPNADAVRHYDRCGVISRPRGRCFVPVVAHVITPIGVAAGPQKCPALSTFACSFGWFCYGLFALVTRNGRQHLGAFRGALATLLRPSTKSFCQLRAISSFIGNETVRSVLCPKVPRPGALLC